MAISFDTTHCVFLFLFDSARCVYVLSNNAQSKLTYNCTLLHFAYYMYLILLLPTAMVVEQILLFRLRSQAILYTGL
jgi:hypothetical protein